MSRAEAAARIARNVHARWNTAPRRDTVLPALMAVAEQAAGLPAPRNTPMGRALTHAQLEVLQLLADGHSHSELYDKLGVTRDAVRSRIYEARQKMGARNKTHAVALALAAGLITVGGER